MQFPSHSLIYTASAPRWLIWVNFAGGFVTVILSLLLGPIFGLHGVVMGTALEMSAVYLFIMPVMVGKLARIHPVRYLLEDVLWPGIKALAIPMLYGWAFSSWLTPDFNRLFLFGAGYALVFAASAPFLALDKQTRAFIRRLLPKPFRT
jgi:O-antigen/teichoic acid export membrane protein